MSLLLFPSHDPPPPQVVASRPPPPTPTPPAPMPSTPTPTPSTSTFDFDFVSDEEEAEILGETAEETFADAIGSINPPEEEKEDTTIYQTMLPLNEQMMRNMSPEQVVQYNKKREELLKIAQSGSSDQPS